MESPTQKNVMILYIINHKFHYEMENICRVFFPYEKIKTVKDGEKCEEQDDKIVHTILSDTQIEVKINIASKQAAKNIPYYEEEKAELNMAQLLFDMMCEITSYRPSWGCLTGVRPSKLMMKLINDNGKKAALDYFIKDLRVSENKARLACEVAEREQKIIDKTSDKSSSLYVSIPFCPTRCNYCSFVSHSVEKTKKLMEPYVEKLCKELEVTGKIVSDLGLRIDTVYFGGGTPTTLEANQLDRLLCTIENNFDLSTVFEYTVEAGRPDTVTGEKLETLKNHGVDRISINPQAFSDDVLREIGRRHTVEDVFKAYEIAKQTGFKNINMDLIAGLSGDTLEGFKNSIKTAIDLSPSNITVHTLALKRSSTIVSNGYGEDDETAETVKMIDFARKELSDSGYFPYYMYRQSRSVGNLENVGWCKENAECAYNIFMMEETQSILSCGAGAVTKLKAPNENYIERIFNHKYPYEYNDRFDELIERKKRIAEFCREYMR